MESHFIGRQKIARLSAVNLGRTFRSSTCGRPKRNHRSQFGWILKKMSGMARLRTARTPWASGHCAPIGRIHEVVLLNELVKAP